MSRLEFFFDCKDHSKGLDNEILSLDFFLGMQAVIAILTSACHDLPEIVQQHSGTANG